MIRVTPNTHQSLQKNKKKNTKTASKANTQPFSECSYANPTYFVLRVYNELW